MRYRERFRDEEKRKKVRKRLNRLKKISKGMAESPKLEKEELRKERRKKIKQVKELKLDYDLVKKFKRRKKKILSIKQKVRELKASRNIEPYSFKKDYIEEQSNTEMISQYDSIKKVPAIIRERIRASVPKPTEKDYKRGYVKRYFVQKANDNRAPITEVSATKFAQIVTNAFYKQVKLRWRIVGPLNDYEDDEGNLKKGVYTSNKRSIEEHLKIMPSLKNRLVHLEEFHQKNI